MMSFFNKVKNMFGSKEDNESRNFRYLDDLIHSGVKEILLDADIVLNRGEESQYLNGIELDVDDLVIDGNGYAIDAQGLTRIFYCTGKNVIIKNIILKNGFSKEDGGAIYNDRGELTITKSTITENTAHRTGRIIYGGGAIKNIGGEITITESTLTQNTAGYGGAIHNDYKGEITITESTLTQNTAQEGSGGAIENSEGNFKIFNCEFLNNNSPNNIILNNDSLQIYNSIFRDNQSEFIVLNDDGANLGIFSGEFRENNAGESVLCNSGKFCSVEKTIFQNNISNYTKTIINKSELTLTNPNIKDKGKCILNQNYILIKKSSPKLKNKIYGEGTVEIDEKLIPHGENFDFRYLDKKIHESNSRKIILDHDITFEDYERDFYEGGIELEIDDLIINGNGHTIDGADKSRIFIITGKNITLKNIIFKNGNTHKNYDNPINQNGGAIRINYDNNITIENCEFINNASEEKGGAIHNYKGEIAITESTLNNNTAQKHGGAIYNCGGLTITDSTLTENTAQSDGGAIHNQEGELTITDSTFTKNTAQRGGAIHNCGGLTITDSTLTENTAQRGGAIHNNESELTITDSTLTENTAQSDGGAIFNENGELTITDSTLTENTAQSDGGAIYNIWGAKLTITDSTFTKNTTKYDGGAIHNQEGELTITDSTFTKNTTKYDGGAIHNQEGELTITDSTFTKNTATRNGGAIHNSKGKLTITNSTLTENNAQRILDKGDGGAIHNQEGELTITESTLNNNTAQKQGGAIYSDKGINIANCILVNNLQSSFSFVENNNKFDIEWNDDFISSDNVTIYLDNKIDGEYHLEDKRIKWDKTLLKGPHGIILELNDNNRIIMNFTYSPEIITTNVNNYAELIDSINKAKYIITPQYIINLNKGDYNATNTIVWKPFLNSNLIINGNGITLNGQNTCQFIRIGTNSKLTLNNIILTNFTANDGGAIHNCGELTITESTLTENTAQDGEGGAIHNCGELTITDSTLTENTASGGGAILNYEGEITITKSTLNNNRATWGGAIHNWGKLTITESTLNNNRATWGGAIHNSWEGELIITESILNENTAQRYGGAIYLDKLAKYNYSKNCTFKDNDPDDVFEDK